MDQATNTHSQSPNADSSTVLVIHGVGDFEHGALVETIAQHWPRQDHSLRSQLDPLERQTLFLQGQRYTTLNETPQRTRLLEINWSEIRRTQANFLGMLKNLALVVLTLTRLGTRGIADSQQISQPLMLRHMALFAVETLLAWASLLPVLSALLWRLPETSRFGVAAAIAVVALYVATLVWRLSRYLAAGAVWFALFTLWAGYLSCVHLCCDPAAACAQTSAGSLGDFCGRDVVSRWTARIHGGAVLISGSILALAMLEIFWQVWRLRPRAPQTVPPVYWLKPFSRVACLWLSTLILAALQPLATSAVLISFSDVALNRWGEAFQQGMLFTPEQGYTMAILMVVIMVSLLMIALLHYFAVRYFGSGLARALLILLASLSAYIAITLQVDTSPECQACIPPNYFSATAIAIAFSVLMAFLVRSIQPGLKTDGRIWHPAGEYARYWSDSLLRIMPMGLCAALGVLLWSTWELLLNKQAISSDTNVSEYMLRAGKYGLLLLPIAVKPVAAIIDALGDVFYWFAPSSSLNTQQDTRRIFDAALAHTIEHGDAQHLIVLSHSQGTVVATHGLCDLAKKLLNSHSTEPAPGHHTSVSLTHLAGHLQNNPKRITLVTLGSPLSSLYDNFFGVQIGREYLQLCRQYPERFAWVNFCRAADYIGSRIALPGVHNFLLATEGDHTGYWEDRILLQWLQRYSQGRSIQQASAFAGGQALLPLPDSPHNK